MRCSLREVVMRVRGARVRPSRECPGGSKTSGNTRNAQTACVTLRRVVEAPIDWRWCVRAMAPHELCDVRRKSTPAWSILSGRRVPSWSHDHATCDQTVHVRCSVRSPFHRGGVDCRAGPAGRGDRRAQESALPDLPGRRRARLARTPEPAAGRAAGGRVRQGRRVRRDDAEGLRARRREAGSRASSRPPT